jgi:hypothetical protein
MQKPINNLKRNFMITLRKVSLKEYYYLIILNIGIACPVLKIVREMRQLKCLD